MAVQQFLTFSVLRRIAALGLMAGLLWACSGPGVINFFTSEVGYDVRKDVAYGAEPRQMLDIYLPQKRDASTPVVVFFYGGSWKSGSKEDYRFVAEGLTSMGFAAIIPDYRLFPQVKYPDFVSDAAQATVWARENLPKQGLDAKNLFVMGHSAGAYNAVMLALNERFMEDAGGRADWIRGAIGLAGPYDFLPFTSPDIQAIFSTEEKPEKTQPITYARRGTPPIFLGTGTRDGTVYPRNSYRLYGALQELGNRVVYKEYDGLGHATLLLEMTTSFSNRHVLRDDVRAFIENAIPHNTIQNK